MQIGYHYVVVSLRNLPRLPVCGCLLVPRAPIYISSIHNATCDFLLHRARAIKVCVFLRRTPPSFLENHDTVGKNLRRISLKVRAISAKIIY